MNAGDEREEEAGSSTVSADRASLVRVLRHTALAASKLGSLDDASKLFDEATRASADDPSDAVQLELAFTCVAEQRQSDPGRTRS